MKNDADLINILKKFPDKNPNPVIQISELSILEYYNKPSNEIIEFYSFKVNKKIDGIIEKHIKKAMISNEHNFEITINTQTFILVLFTHRTQIYKHVWYQYNSKKSY